MLALVCRARNAKNATSAVHSKHEEHDDSEHGNASLPDFAYFLARTILTCMRTVTMKTIFSTMFKLVNKKIMNKRMEMWKRWCLLWCSDVI